MHNSFVELAEIREAEARTLSLDDILMTTVRNALRAPGAKPTEKIEMALATIPATDPHEAKGTLSRLIDRLIVEGSLTTGEGGSFKDLLKGSQKMVTVSFEI